MADKLKQAIQLIQSGDVDRARQLLLEKLKADPENDTAWAWMATVVDTVDLKQECLEEALKHNPHNEVARRALAEIGRQPAPFQDQIESTASNAVEARPDGTSARRRKVNRLALLIFLLALIVVALIYVVNREELAYRNDGEVASASVLELDKTAGSNSANDACSVDYQFMAYGALRKGSSDFPCAEWDHVEKSRLVQVQFQANHPGLNRYWPRPDNAEHLMWGGFGFGGLLMIVSLGLVMWGLLPRKSTP